MEMSKQGDFLKIMDTNVGLAYLRISGIIQVSKPANLAGPHRTKILIQNGEVVKVSFEPKEVMEYVNPEKSTYDIEAMS